MLVEVTGIEPVSTSFFYRCSFTCLGSSSLLPTYHILEPMNMEVGHQFAGDESVFHSILFQGLNGTHQTIKQRVRKNLKTQSYRLRLFSVWIFKRILTHRYMLNWSLPPMSKTLYPR